MKKITLLFLLGAFNLVDLAAQDDKAFHKGTITVDPTVGFAIYKTKIQIFTNNSHYHKL